MEDPIELSQENDLSPEELAEFGKMWQGKKETNQQHQAKYEEKVQSLQWNWHARWGDRITQHSDMQIQIQISTHSA